MFVARLPERAADLERSVAAGDLDSVTKQAHQLKGTSAGYGFAGISEAAAALEASAKSRLGVDALRQQLEKVADLCRRARSSAPVNAGR
jgi:HPt (histidine-containing phosphotransfer) domain-containing protein